MTKAPRQLNKPSVSELALVRMKLKSTDDKYTLLKSLAANTYTLSRQVTALGDH